MKSSTFSPALSLRRQLRCNHVVALPASRCREEHAIADTRLPPGHSDGATSGTSSGINGRMGVLPIERARAPRKQRHAVFM